MGKAAIEHKLEVIDGKTNSEQSGQYKRFFIFIVCGI